MKMFKNYYLLLVLTLVFSLSGCSPDTNPDPDYNVPTNPTSSWCTIKYNANGGMGMSLRDKFVKKGETIEVASKGDMFYSGRSFDTWNTKADGSGTAYAEGSSLIANEDLTLYAQWFVLPYTITYDSNNGIGTIPEQEVIIGEDVILSDGSGLSRAGYIFNGWNISSDGGLTHYAACSTLTPSRNMYLYAIWAAPAINNSDNYKTVTSDGTVKITLLKGVRYVHESMKKYYLYRSEESNGEYIKISEFTPPSPSSQFTFEDKTVDWSGSVTSYSYKVAAVLEDDTEMMSINGMHIYLSSPTVYMQRSIISSAAGYCGLILSQGHTDKSWEIESSTPNTRYELRFNGILGAFGVGNTFSAGNYTLYTASSKNNWKSRGEITLKCAHITTIYISEDRVVSEFDKSCWYPY
jgi:hypothetical protein